jgi:hypothetical protein
MFLNMPFSKQCKSIKRMHKSKIKIKKSQNALPLRSGEKFILPL